MRLIIPTYPAQYHPGRRANITMRVVCSHSRFPISTSCSLSIRREECAFNRGGCARITRAGPSSSTAPESCCLGQYSPCLGSRSRRNGNMKKVWVHSRFRCNTHMRKLYSPRESFAKLTSKPRNIPEVRITIRFWRTSIFSFESPKAFSPR